MHYLTNLWNSLDFGSMKDLLLRLCSVFLCLTVHETCHGLAAYALGDPTAKRQHRLSLNPLRHIDWFGLAMMVVAGFGWAKPVPVNPNYFKNPKRGMAITALAGPVSNFLLSLMLLLSLSLVWGHRRSYITEFEMFLLETAILSIGLGVFNLIPIPPLDGYHVLNDLILKGRLYASRKLAGAGQAILYLALFSGVLTDLLGYVYDAVLSGVGSAASALLHAFGLF